MFGKHCSDEPTSLALFCFVFSKRNKLIQIYIVLKLNVAF